MKTTEGTKTYEEYANIPNGGRWSPAGRDDEFLGVISLYLVDEFDKVAVTVLAEVLGAQVRQLILGLDVGGSDLALLHQLLHENVPQREVLCTKTVGGAVADDVQRHVLLIYSGTLAKLSSEPSTNFMLEQNATSFNDRRALPLSWTVRSAPAIPS